MKKVLYILLVILLPGPAIGQIEEINIQLDYDSISHEKTLFVSNEDMKFLKHEPKCSMDHGLYLKDSLPDGEYHVYFNGILSYRAFYQGSVRNGKWIHYHKDGEVWYEEEYLNGIKRIDKR